MGLEIGCGGLSAAWIFRHTDGKFCDALGHNLNICEEDIKGFEDLRGVSTDSRSISSGDIFVAIRGERYDGHVYIKSALDSGAYCVICETVPIPLPGEQYRDNALFYVVDDTVKMLSDIAHGYREKYKMPLVAVTGSVGKTTTKQFIYYVLSRRYRTLKTEGNLNNLIGLPMTVLRADDKTEAAVVEMGMSSLGEISTMSRAAVPDVAVITNIGTSHIGLLGSREAICSAKIEILDGLKSGGAVIYNGDEPLLDKLKCMGNYSFFDISFRNRSAYCYIDNIREYRTVYGTVSIKTVFDISLNGSVVCDVEIPVIGCHNVFDAAVAYVIGRLFGIDDIEIRAGLSDFENTGFRQRIFTCDGVNVIEDCYNASPESMEASLKVLRSTAVEKCGTKGRRIAVLGDMKELGDKSEELHKRIGRAVARENIDFLYTVGEEARNIAVGAVEVCPNTTEIISYGMPNDEINSEIASEIKKGLREGDVILFKASRAMQLEKIVSLIFG